MLILFDIDDTLIDHSTAVRTGVAALHDTLRPAAELSAFHAAWVDAMKQHFPKYLRGTLTYEEQRRSRMRQVVDAGLSDVDADELFATYFSTYESAWSLFPDVLPCLDAIAGHRLGIISNGNGVEQRNKLERTGIAGRFASVHISNDCGYAKPAAEIFQMACRSASVPCEAAIYIGDMYDVDAIGARQAGLRGVWLNRDSRAGDHAQPIIGGLDELPELLRTRSTLR